MTIRDILRRLASCLLAALILVAHNSPLVQARRNSEPERTLRDALAATGPDASLGDQARVFDPLVGVWDCDYTFFRDDGTTEHASGELLFGWILDGLALQDIWITSHKNMKEREIGTSIRFFDRHENLWRVIFVAPQFDALTEVKGGLEGERIVLRGTNSQGRTLRWSFNDITPDSFTWRGEISQDGGKTWRLREDHHMKRRS